MKPGSGHSGRVMVVLATLCLAAWLLTPASLHGQEGSGQPDPDYKSIEEAMRAAYESGDLQQIIDLYHDHCIKERRKFRNQMRKIRAGIYQWAALAYTALDQTEKAAECIKKLLVTQRGEPPDKDWLALRKIAHRYIVKPGWLMGIKMGLDFTTARPFKRYSILHPAGPGGEETYEKDYIFHPYHSMGPQVASLTVEYTLARNLAVSFQPCLANLDFLYDHTLRWEEGGTGSARTIEFRHLQSLDYLEMPVLFKGQFQRKKTSPYVQVGGYCQFLLSGYKRMTIKSHRDNEENIEKTVNIEGILKKFILGFWIGAGISFETGVENLRLEIEANYKHGLSNIVATRHRYENRDLLYGYYDVFDDMQLRTWNISVKVLLPLSHKTFRR